MYLALSIVTIIFGREKSGVATCIFRGSWRHCLEPAGRLSAYLCQAANQDRLVSQGTGDTSQQNTFFQGFSPWRYSEGINNSQAKQSQVEISGLPRWIELLQSPAASPTYQTLLLRTLPNLSLAFLLYIYIQYFNI